jgi:hypothetical protein
MIVLLLNLKIFENKKDDENIIDRQSLFCQVSGEILNGGCRTAFIVYVYQESEKG